MKRTNLAFFGVTNWLQTKIAYGETKLIILVVEYAVGCIMTFSNWHKLHP